MIYPQPFGVITAASEKAYPVDYSHFNIMGTAVGAHGMEEDSDKAIFPNVKLEVRVGRDKGLKFRYPWIISAMGSTNVAKNNVVVQANIEDTRLGVQEYSIEQLGVTCVELKWGQGAKDIGGEVKINNLRKAQLLYERGYVVLPNPTDPVVIRAFERGAFKEFERHSRVGMVTEEGFAQRVEALRKAGAKYIFLKTGAYRPVDLARAVAFSSRYRIDLLTVDAAGGGTGMSPWHMMNEWGVPPVELHSLLYQYLKAIDERGDYVPPVAVGGGFTFEGQIFKGLALGAPYVKLVGMARAPLAAAMVGKAIGRAIEENQLPVYVERFGNTLDEIFVTASHLRHALGDDTFEKLPPGAIGLYTYYERLAQGLRQLMAGSRKFSVEYISRGDIAALTHEAAAISGIPYMMGLDKEEARQIIENRELVGAH